MPANCSAGAVALPLLNVPFWSNACLFGFACPLECKILLLIAAGAALALFIATLVRIIRLCQGRDTTRYEPVPMATVASVYAAASGRARFNFEKSL
jgi:hypothetical protein